jgi:hypothetical protein
MEFGSAQERLHQAVVDELVQIRKIANESIPPRNLDLQNVRPKLEAIDGHAEKAVSLLKGEG